MTDDKALIRSLRRHGADIVDLDAVNAAKAHALAARVAAARLPKDQRPTMAPGVVASGKQPDRLLLTTRWV